jgi:hypothetical protein
LEANDSPEDNDMENYAPPDPYEPHLQQRRAAAATPLSTFEERCKRERLTALDAEYRNHEAAIAAKPSPRLTATQLAEYKAPDPYEHDIKALRQKEPRR